MKKFRLFTIPVLIRVLIIPLIMTLIVVLISLIVSCSDPPIGGNGGNNGIDIKLSYSALIKDNTGGRVDGLDGANRIVVSPDGKHVYVTGQTDDAVAVFNRNTSTGALAYSALIKNGSSSGGKTVDGLDGANGIVVSPDGKYVYVTGFDDDAVVVFNRDTSTGALTYSAVIKNGSSSGGNTVAGLDGANDIEVSADGQNVYVVGKEDDAVVVFRRNTSTGVLTYSALIKDNNKGGTADGLDGARGIVVSPNGNQVYVTGFDEDAIAVFNRDTSTGALTYSAVIKNGASSGGKTVAGLNGAWSIDVSPDEKQVYVAGHWDNAVSVFDRNTSTGALTYSAAIKNTDTGIDGIDRAKGIVVSSDGQNVYVTGQRNDAVAVFNRSMSTGALTYSAFIKNTDTGTNGLDGASGIVVSSDGKHVYVTGQTDDAVVVFNRSTSTGALSYLVGIKNNVFEIDGLDGARGVVVSPDGQHVYVMGGEDDAVAVFNRNTSTGALTYLTVIKDTDTGVDGLNGVRNIVVSPDGKQVYVTGWEEDSVAVFTRNVSTGALTYSAVIKNGSSSGSNTVDGLDGAWDIVVSPDEKQVYVTGYWDDAVAVFTRDVSTGALTYSAVIKNGASSGGNTVAGLDGAWDIVVSPDEKQVYVTGYWDDGVAVFDRNTSTGVLTYLTVIKDTDTGIDGLDGANGIVLSPDGKQVYVTGYVSDSVVVFNRNTSTGVLTYSAMFKDNTKGVDGLDGASGIVVSPDGKQVYVTGNNDNAVAVFTRNTNTGELTYLGIIKDNRGGVDGLDGANGIVVSPDGKQIYVTGHWDDSVVTFINRD